MISSKHAKQILGALAGCALCFSSTAAGATTAVRAQSINPWVALSAFSTPASASAVCAAGAAAVSAAQMPAEGCVLPAVDQAPPPPVPAAPAVTPAAVPVVRDGGIGLLPILLGLAAIAGIAALVLSGDDDDDDDEEVPISP